MSLSREPTADELAGLEWWHSLSEPRRSDWLQLADTTRPAEAWAEYKRRTTETGCEKAGAKIITRGRTDPISDNVRANHISMR